MSPDLERLVGRAILDREFRKQLLDDPDGAIKAGGFVLEPDELRQVRDAVKARDPQRGVLDAELDQITARSVWG